MSLLDALAAALRDRLLADGAAAVPGHGTLQRQRAAARMQEQADGSRLLLPPSETVVFTPGPGAADAPLANALARHLGRADGTAALREAADQLDGLLAATGTSVLPGVGTLRRTGAGIAFEIDPALLAAVGQPYDGLAPVSAETASAAAPTADAGFVDEETLDDDLDDVLDDGVLAVPFDASGGLGLNAILPTTAPEHDPSVSAPTTADAAPVEDDARPMPPPGVRAPIPPSRAERPPEAAPPPPAEPPAAAPEPAGPDERVTAGAGALATEDSELDWLNAYDDADPPEGVAASGAAPAVASTASPPPAPPPSLEPAEERSSRSGVWLWALVPLLALVAAFFWFRATQTTDGTAPSPAAESSARLAAEPPPADSLIADATPPVADSAAAADSLARSAAAGALADSARADAAASRPDSAALAGEFSVRELAGGATGAPGGATSATPGAAGAAPPSPQAARSTPAARRSPIDPPPDLTALSEADRAALVGSAPIVVGRGGFSWVVLSTRERQPAERRARLFRDAGWRVRVLQTEALGDTVFRVALGQFDSREQADRLRPLLPPQVPADTWRLDLSTL